MLTVEGLDVYIQSSHILRQVSLEVRDREVVCLVGRNGAGKTTTLRAIMGYLRPRAGRIVFQGEEIHGRRTHEIAQRGLGFAPEDSGIFTDLTVAENIEIATWTRPGGRPAAERIERAYEVFPVLRGYRHRKGPEMSGGERKMLSVARARARSAHAAARRPFEASAYDHPRWSVEASPKSPSADTRSCSPSQTSTTPGSPPASRDRARRSCSQGGRTRWRGMPRL
jgi:ABC-type sugar transport system ATPase subunit